MIRCWNCDHDVDRHSWNKYGNGCLKEMYNTLEDTEPRLCPCMLTMGLAREKKAKKSIDYSFDLL